MFDHTAIEPNARRKAPAAFRDGYAVTAIIDFGTSRHARHVRFGFWASAKPSFQRARSGSNE